MAGILSIFARKMIAQAGSGARGPRLFRLVGLDPDAPTDTQTLIPEPDYLTLLETIADESVGPLDFHVRMGKSMRGEDLGVMGLAFKAAPRLRDSLERFIRYSRLVNAIAAFDLLSVAGRVHLTMVREGQRPGTYLSNEAALVTISSLVQEAAGRPVRFVEVRYRHDPLPSATALETHFGCPVRFAQAYDGLVFDGDDLERPNRIGDEGMHNYFGAQLEEALSNQSAATRIDHLVRHEVAECLADGVPRVALVAARLGMSERTLQRRLGEIGVSFPALVETTRRQFAERLLLETNHGMAEVAFLTGFSEHSAFTRAFKRWTGQAPSAFRRASRTP